MRLFLFAVLVASLTAAGTARATPFEPATIPDQVDVVGHVDVDALRKTVLFSTVSNQWPIEAALDEAPAELRPIAQALMRNTRGISFWRDVEHGALYIETRDGRALAGLASKLPVTPLQVVDGVQTYSVSEHAGGHHGGHHGSGFAAAAGDTLVLADSAESLERSIHVLVGKGANLAGSNKLPTAARAGVFVFVALGDSALGSIQKSARSKVLQLGIRSIVIDASELSGGVLVANARAEMASADALAKARSILDGLRALASLEADNPARVLLGGVTVSDHGTTLEVNAKLPVADLIKLMHDAHS